MKDKIFSFNSLRIFFRLMQRHGVEIRSRLRTLLIDGIILLVVDSFVIAKIFPLFNIPLNFLAPLFVADTFIMILFIQGDTFCARMALDVIQNRFIQYYLTLPLHNFWVFLSYHLTFLFETIIISLPLMSVGVWFFNSVIPSMQPIWPIFLLHYFISILFVTSFFLYVAFRYPFSWIENNLWPRRLAPMFCLGATYVTWYQLNSFSSTLSAIGLCNPLTYVAEGFRATLLQGVFLPFLLSEIMLLFATGISLYLLRKGIVKRLDPV